jgi:hypothetical protein
MMDHRQEHQARVAAWMSQVASGLPSTDLLRLLRGAFEVLWWRARFTLGDVTLAAIVDRVLHTASAQFPVLAPLTVETAGIRFDELNQRIDAVLEDELAEGMSFALAEFLTVLGHLTAELLTPTLYEALSKVTLDTSERPEREVQAQPRVREGRNGRGVT